VLGSVECVICVCVYLMASVLYLLYFLSIPFNLRSLW